MEIKYSDIMDIAVKSFCKTCRKKSSCQKSGAGHCTKLESFKKKFQDNLMESGYIVRCTCCGMYKDISEFTQLRRTCDSCRGVIQTINYNEASEIFEQTSRQINKLSKVKKRMVYVPVKDEEFVDELMNEKKKELEKSYKAKTYYDEKNSLYIVKKYLKRDKVSLSNHEVKLNSLLEHVKTLEGNELRLANIKINRLEQKIKKLNYRILHTENILKESSGTS